MKVLGVAALALSRIFGVMVAGARRRTAFADVADDASAAALADNATRLEGGQAEARREVLVEGSHAIGLEAEHHWGPFSRTSAWQVTQHDKRVLESILTRLNPPGADSTFTWKEEGMRWTYGLVKKTEQTPKSALALHMLHRHGLAPLLVSRTGNGFAGCMKAQQPPRGWSSLKPWKYSWRHGYKTDLEFFVATLEQCATVKDMKTLLEGLSLSALRNLHSFDHQWSVNMWTGRIPGCSQQRPATCVLQAGVSSSAWRLLSNEGFTEQSARQAQSSMDLIVQKLQSGATGLAPHVSQAFFAPNHTGVMRPEMRVVQNPRMDFDSLTGSILWEDTGKRSAITIHITKYWSEELRKLQDAEQKKRIMQGMLEEKMEEVMSQHKAYMFKHRLEIWASEEAEFWEMHPRYLNR